MVELIREEDGKGGAGEETSGFEDTKDESVDWWVGDEHAVADLGECGG